MGMSFWHLLVVLVVVFIVFGAGKLPRVMGDLGKGIRSFRDGLKNEDDTKALESKDDSKR
jgi:sec-independent protein translocase protein TatA